MTFQSLLKIFISVSLVLICSSECENGCSGHGRCTVYDMCICMRNWQGNDCSERVCQFGLSFVDVPKGDLDSSDSLDGPEVTVAINDPQFPFGTTEQFPNMVNSDQEIVGQSAHWYAECSNAGVCNRDSGECECYEGFEGVACNRMQCPGEHLTCSGHGVCQNLKQIAKKDHGSDYDLWGKNIIRGCVCDYGFYGGDCSLRKCKYGIDPLYIDDVATIQYPSFFFSVMTTAPTYDISNGFAQPGPGQFNIKVYDQFDQPFFSSILTAPATCEDIIEALEAVPNRIIPKGYTDCFSTSILDRNPLNATGFGIKYQSLYRYYRSGTKDYEIQNKPATVDAGFESTYQNGTSYDSTLIGHLYHVQFYGNPGYMRQPEINLHIGNGKQAMLQSRAGVLVTKSWTNGQFGLNTDYFTRHCRGIRVSIVYRNGQTYLIGPISMESLLACLGTSDYDEDNNDVLLINGKTHSYDLGSTDTPHLIRLVRTQTDVRDGGFLAALVYDDGHYIDTQSGAVTNHPTSAFRLLHPLYTLDDNERALFDIFATDGVLRKIHSHSQAEFDFGASRIFISNATIHPTDAEYDGDLTCEKLAGPGGVGFNTSTMDCLDKNDFFILLDPTKPTNNPPFLNLHKAESIRRVDDRELQEMGELFTLNPNVTRSGIRNIITTDINTNWNSNEFKGNRGKFYVYKFTPSAFTKYDFVSQCSNRGLCNTFEGICECFGGYTGDACQLQDALAT